MIKNLQEDIRQRFMYLETDYGFSMADFRAANPISSNNFLAHYEGEDLYIKITREKGRVQVRFSIDNTYWDDKDVLLEAIGIPRDRYPTTDLGFWTGYTLEAQVADLNSHIDLIITHLLHR